MSSTSPPSTSTIIYKSGLRIAIEGCGHGTLNSIYSSVQKAEKNHHFKVDLLIICGDFQAVRNAQDLNCMSVPIKYRTLGDFHLYYSGKIKAPILTLFIGGNHEASNHNWELYYGGWVCPNIYYLGAANVVQIGGLRIAGISGIYNHFDYGKPHYERVPYGGKDVKTIYHVREYEAYKLLQLRESVDIGLSHDWPQGIEHHGDINWLLRTKPWFRKDIERNSLGSPPARSLLYKWKPRYWFSAHMHIKYAAVVDHSAPQQAQIKRSELMGDLKEGVQEAPLKKDQFDLERDLQEGQEQVTLRVDVKNQDEIQIELDLEIDEPGNNRRRSEKSGEIPLNMKDEHASPRIESKTTPTSTNPSLEDISTSHSPSLDSIPSHNITRFLSLDKCLPQRDFLQILEIPARKSDRIKDDDPTRLTLQYDPEWLAITRALNPFLGTSHNEAKQLEKDEAKLRVMIDAERKWVEENIVRPGKLEIPHNWEKTVPAEGEEKLNPNKQPTEYNNPQTGTFCQLLGFENKIWSTGEQRGEYLARWKRLQSTGDASYSGRKDYKGGWKGGGKKPRERPN